MNKRLLICVTLLVSLFIPLFIGSPSVLAKKGDGDKSQGKWWDTVCEDENPSDLYDSIL